MRLINKKMAEISKMTKKGKSLDIKFGGTGMLHISIFAKMLAMMLRAGIPIGEALTISQDIASGRLITILGDLAKSVRSGSTLSTSLSLYPRVFSPLFVNTVKVGETAGTLPENLDALAVELYKEHSLLAKIRGTLMYPIIVLCAAGGMISLMAFFVLPKLVPLLSSLHVDLPLSTRILIWFVAVMQAYGVFIVIGMAGLFIALMFIVRQPFSRPVTHWILLHMPVTKKVARSANLSRFCRTLGTLIKTGVTIDKAFTITADATSNVYYREAILAVGQRISKGTKLSSAFDPDDNLFPVFVGKMLRTGEESGQLPMVLLYVANFYEEELENSTKLLSAAIEPLLLLGLGLMVAFLALAIITPIFNATGSIK